MRRLRRWKTSWKSRIRGRQKFGRLSKPCLLNSCLLQSTLQSARCCIPFLRPIPFHISVSLVRPSFFQPGQRIKEEERKRERERKRQTEMRKKRAPKKTRTSRALLAICTRTETICERIIKIDALEDTRYPKIVDP